MFIITQISNHSFCVLCYTNIPHGSQRLDFSLRVANFYLAKHAYVVNSGKHACTSSPVNLVIYSAHHLNANNYCLNGLLASFGC